MRPLFLPDDEARVRAGGASVVAVGKFDGVHRGHQAVIAEARAHAAARGLTTTALTFDPHPAEVVGPEDQRRPWPRLTSLSRRAELLGRAGADRVVVRRFDAAFAAWSPEAFARDLLASTLGARVVLVGENFRFGAQRAGDLRRLEELGAELGFEARVHPIAGDDAGPFSSTRARAAIAPGDVAEAARVLGRWHAVTGVVGHGKKLGRTIGFPTANVEAIAELLPADGIYATVIDVVDARPGGEGARALGVAATSIGVRPTIEGATGRTVEAYLLDLDRDLYGATLRVHFVARLRDELRFESLEALKAQIARDVEATRVAAAGIAPGAGGAYG